MVSLPGILRSLTLAVAVLLSVACTLEPAAKPKPTQSDSHSHPSVSTPASPRAATPATAQAPLLTYVTVETAHADPTKPLPWVVALHGLGDRPQAFAHLFEAFPSEAHIYCVQAPRRYGPGFDWFGVRASGDPLKLAAAIRRATAQVAELIAVLQAMPKNSGKPVVTGFSQGGMLSFALATLSGGAIQESLPIGGWLPPPLWPAAPFSEAAPIRAFHGEADRVVPWRPTRDSVQYLQSSGFDATVTSYPSLGHSINASLRRDWFKALAAALHKLP